MSVSNILRRNAKLYPEKVAIYFENKEITYKRLDNEVDNIAHGLIDMGVKLGDRIAVILGNSPDFIRSYFAITRVGATVIPLNPLYKAGEIKYILNDAKVSIVITSCSFLSVIKGMWDNVPSLQSLIVVHGETNGNVISFEEILNKCSEPTECEIDDEVIAACLYTSGTTGKPKGALLSNINLTFDCEGIVERTGYVFSDIHICALPLFHSFCQTAVVLAGFYCGGSIVVIPQFRIESLFNEIKDKRATVFCGVPAMYNAIITALNNGNTPDLSSLRLCLCGGAPMPVEIINSFEEKYNICILEGNGPTETSPVSYVNKPTLRKIGSVGPPILGVKVKIVNNEDEEVSVGESGEICIQGKNVMKGYLNQSHATAEVMKGGYFHTGDIGKVDEDGYVYILDRKKDMVIVGGLNVYPREIEEYLYTNSKISEVAVIGVSDGERGEVPLAVVSLKLNQTATIAELIVYCREGLANYKCPRNIIFIDRIPKNATGKIDKKQLKEAYIMGLIK
ncbi:MAG: long-chain fatty acid--CoA ligase [Bacillota bacterium]|nr:long-chain fatty acid--CoA ligase [Bacillota bacterium]